MKNFLGFGNGNKAQQEIDHLRMQLTTSQTTVTQLSAQLETLQEQLSRREKQLNDERSIVDMLRKEKTQLTATIQTQSSKIASTQSQKQTLNTQNHKLEVQLEHMKDTKNLIRKKMNNQDEEISELKEGNQHLNDKLVAVRENAEQVRESLQQEANECKKQANQQEKMWKEKVKRLEADSELLKLDKERQEKAHQALINVYRGHLVNAARGTWLPAAKNAILRIIEESESKSESSSGVVSSPSSRSTDSALSPKSSPPEMHKENERPGYSRLGGDPVAKRRADWMTKNGSSTVSSYVSSISRSTSLNREYSRTGSMMSRLRESGKHNKNEYVSVNS